MNKMYTFKAKLYSNCGDPEFIEFESESIVMAELKCLEITNTGYCYEPGNYDLFVVLHGIEVDVIELYKLMELYN